MKRGMRIRRPDFAGRNCCKTTSTFYRVARRVGRRVAQNMCTFQRKLLVKEQIDALRGLGVDEVILAIPSEGQFASRVHVIRDLMPLLTTNTYRRGWPDRKVTGKAAWSFAAKLPCRLETGGCPSQVTTAEGPKIGVAFPEAFHFDQLKWFVFPDIQGCQLSAPDQRSIERPSLTKPDYCERELSTDLHLTCNLLRPLSHRKQYHHLSFARRKR